MADETVKTTPTTTTGTVTTTTPMVGNLPAGATGNPNAGLGQPAQQEKLSQSAQGLQSAFQARQDASQGKINSLFDKQLESQKLALQGAYEQNLSDQLAARQQIGSTYRQASNDLAVQYERNRRNLNEQALANGLNTGTGSQQQLALNQQYTTGYGQLMGQKAGALAEADRQITNLKNNYQNQIASAIADNDYKRAAALLDDYNNQNNWMDQQAQIMASYGDFSAYANLYGADQANAMRQIWAMQNPDIAWATGNITKEEYMQVTGKMPNFPMGIAATGAAGVGGGGSGWNDATGLPWTWANWSSMAGVGQAGVNQGTPPGSQTESGNMVYTPQH